MDVVVVLHLFCFVSLYINSVNSELATNYTDGRAPENDRPPCTFDDFAYDYYQYLKNVVTFSGNWELPRDINRKGKPCSLINRDGVCHYRNRPSSECCGGYCCPRSYRCLYDRCMNPKEFSAKYSNVTKFVKYAAEYGDSRVEEKWPFKETAADQKHDDEILMWDYCQYVKNGNTWNLKGEDTVYGTVFHSSKGSVCRYKYRVAHYACHGVCCRRFHSCLNNRCIPNIEDGHHFSNVFENIILYSNQWKYDKKYVIDGYKNHKTYVWDGFIYVPNGHFDCKWVEKMKMTTGKYYHDTEQMPQDPDRKKTELSSNSQGSNTARNDPGHRSHNSVAASQG